MLSNRLARHIQAIARNAAARDARAMWFPLLDRQSAIASASVLYSSAFAEDFAGIHGRPRLLIGDVIRIHQTQPRETEVSHGAGRCADVQRIASGDQDHAQVFLEAARSRYCSR